MLARYFGIIPFLLFAVMLGCDSNDDDNNSVQPGFFKLANSYELGDVKNTTPFVFNFLNGGGTDIVNITLTSSNPAFVLNPEFIPVLEPLSEQTLNQSLRIIAIHGTGENGLGGAEVMSPGRNQTVLRITGKTTNMFGDTLIASQQAAVRVNALLVQVEVHDANGLISLDAPTGTVLATIVAPWILNRYRVADGSLQFVNTGNVDLTVRIFKRIDTTVYEETEVQLLPGQDVNVERDRENIFFRIDGSNTMSEAAILPIQPDGLIYISFAP